MDHLIRKIGFWILDFIKGREVRRNYLEVENIIKNDLNNETGLKNILTYATNNCEFYKDIKIIDLKSFPVVNKEILQNEYNKILCGDISEKKLHWTCTSGSTGTPLKIPQNIEKRNRTKADLIFFNERIGWHLGFKYVFIRSWVKSYKMSKLRIFAQNFIKFDTNCFNDEEKEKLRQVLKKDRKIKCIISYASAIGDFVKYLEEKNDNASMFNIKVIVTASDELTENVKNKLKKMFNCKIINRISNEEHGLLGMQFDGDSYFTLNTASYYYEILKLDSNNPAEIGELGRLVITDLYNTKFPLIRYDIGDLAIAKSENANGSINKLQSFEGRSSDVIYSDIGIPYTSVTISTHLCTLKGIKKYQLNCYANRIVVLIVPKIDNIDTMPIKLELENLLGKNRKIEVKLVDDILVEKNGKYKVIKNIR